MADLNKWHHAVHQVTGDMALRFNKATAADLERWAKALREVADEMEAVAKPMRQHDSVCAYQQHEDGRGASRTKSPNLP
jgi:hypothetical protein